MQEHAATTNRQFHIANLDPAAETFLYEPSFDIRDLISVEEVMEELGLGPNGALIYCMEYLLENLDWLESELEKFVDDEYLILDCPGQLELYTHVPIMRHVIDRMKRWGHDGYMVSVFCVDTAFLVDTSKFLSGKLLSLSAMVAIELPHVTVLTKCDMMKEEEVEKILDFGSASEIWDVEQDRQSLTFGQEDSNGGASTEEIDRLRMLERRRLNRDRMTDSICQLLDDWQMVSYIPLNIKSEDSIGHVLSVVNHTIQYGEDLEVRGAEREHDMPETIQEAEDHEFE